MSTLAATGVTMPWLWLASRASGLVLLVMFTVVVVLGVSSRLGAPARRSSRLVVAEMHRTLALFAVAFLALHVVTAIVDPYVNIGWWAAVLPFASHYRPLALGLGTLAVDLGAAVILTSLARKHLGFRLWRAVHWLAYLSWPLAFVHGLTAGATDLRFWWVAATEWGCAGAVAIAVGARVLSPAGTAPVSGELLRSEPPRLPAGVGGAG
jgi:sulfoxide reductase heme-binding subunit YedZ